MAASISLRLDFLGKLDLKPICNPQHVGKSENPAAAEPHGWFLKLAAAEKIDDSMRRDTQGASHVAK
jgi:hypothetical protein